MKFIGIIPARYASSRFPGKPLANIGGVPMIERVYRRASQALERVVVATDDQRIFDAVKAFGGDVVMTSDAHRSGTDRCFEAYTRCGSTADVIINIQGDEPFIDPAQIDALCRCFDRPDTRIATLVRRFDPAAGFDALKNPNTPKVVLDDSGRALYFSRSVIPYVRGAEEQRWSECAAYFTHVGIYAFRADTLAELVNLPQSSLELAESLEQLRWLQAGYRIQTAVTSSPTVGIDTPDDLRRAEEYLASLSSSPDRSTPPPVVEFSEVELPEIASETLPNGIGLSVLNAGEQDLCRLEFYRSGGLCEADDPAAWAVMAASMRDLTADYSGSSIADIIDFNGARFTSSSIDHFTMLGLLVMERNLAPVLPVVMSVFTRAEFNERTVATAARSLAAAAANRLARVMYVASSEARRAAAGADNPVARELEPADFESVTADRVRACYRQFCSRSVSVFMGGRFSDASLELVRSCIGALPSVAPSQLKVVPFHPESPSKVVIPMQGAVQAAVSMALPAISREHPDYIPLRLTVMALGGYFGSRLMTNIREQKGLTYGITAALYGSREGAYVQIDAQCDAAFVDQVIAETDAEIRNLVANPPVHDELRRLRMHAWSVLAASCDSPLTILDYYTTRLKVGTPSDYIRRQLHAIAALTPETISEMASKYLTAPMFTAIAK